MKAVGSAKIFEPSDEFRWNLLQEKAQALRVGRAFELFRGHGIEPVLIKGWAAARLYPAGHFRLSVDTDLAVSAVDYDQAKIIAKSDAAIGLAIDLHRELRHLDTVAWDDLFQHSRLIAGETGSFRVLCEEDHLRVLCVHWLGDGGSGEDRLWDIYYGIANRSPHFDWSRFLDTVSKRRRRWLICAIGAAHHFLGLDLDGTPVTEAATDLPQWFIRTIEKEWASDIKTQPLETSLGSSYSLLTQIIKRLNPNPIWATVQMEGSFDARTRFFYKIGNTLSRIFPSYKRISAIVKANFR